MSYVYEPEIDEEDGGYSIPKILVAVLILVLIGAGTYIYFQQKKLKTSVAYLLDAKKQVELDLNAMIEKYNLAIDDNDFLADELREERDRIIGYRDSIKNVKGEDFGKIASYEKQIKNLKDNSAIVFSDVPLKLTNNADDSQTDLAEVENSDEIIEDIPVEDKKPENKKITKPQTKIIKPRVSNNDLASTEETVIPTETIIEKPIETKPEIETPKKIEPKKVEAPSKKSEVYTNFVRVEIPPTYPGCKGSATEKKACFTKKIKNHLARKFNTSVAEYYNLDTGKKRIWVSFDIDKFGNVVNVNARSPRNMLPKAKSALESEAIRVVKGLPKMTAARQNGSSVKINYSVPITFVVQ